jgi:hypothetical protein
MIPGAPVDRPPAGVVDGPPAGGRFEERGPSGPGDGRAGAGHGLPPPPGRPPPPPPGRLPAPPPGRLPGPSPGLGAQGAPPGQGIAGPALPAPPLDVGGLLEWSAGAFARHWRQLALIVLVLRGTITLLLVLSGASATAGPFGGTMAYIRTRGFEAAPPVVVAFAVALTVADVVVLQPAYAAAITRASLGTYLGETPSADRTIRFGLRRFGSVLLITVLVVLVLAALLAPLALLAVGLAVAAEPPGSLGAGALVLGLAGLSGLILLAVRLSLVTQAFVAEGHRGRAALRRSWRLTQRRFWRVSGVLLVGAFLSGVMTFAVTTIASRIPSGTGLVAATVGGVGSVAAQAVSAPFVSLLMAALYFAVVGSKEPLDARASLEALRRLDGPGRGQPSS